MVFKSQRNTSKRGYKTNNYFNGIEVQWLTFVLRYDKYFLDCNISIYWYVHVLCYHIKAMLIALLLLLSFTVSLAHNRCTIKYVLYTIKVIFRLIPSNFTVVVFFLNETLQWKYNLMYRDTLDDEVFKHILCHVNLTPHKHGILSSSHFLQLLARVKCDQPSWCSKSKWVYFTVGYFSVPCCYQVASPKQCLLGPWSEIYCLDYQIDILTFYGNQNLENLALMLCGGPIGITVLQRRRQSFCG